MLWVWGCFSLLGGKCLNSTTRQILENLKVTGLKQPSYQGPRSKRLSFPRDLRHRLAPCGTGSVP